jgi:hypothetical protein
MKRIILLALSLALLFGCTSCFEAAQQALGLQPPTGQVALTPLERANQANENLITLQNELNVLQSHGYVSAKLHDQIDPFLTAAFAAVKGARVAAKEGDAAGFAAFMADYERQTAEVRARKGAADVTAKAATRTADTQPN